MSTSVISPVETIHASLTLSLSDFKRNPSAAVRTAQGRTLAVLNHNRVSFYVVDPAAFEALLGRAATPAPGPAPIAQPGLLRQIETRQGETPENPGP